MEPAERELPEVKSAVECAARHARRYWLRAKTFTASVTSMESWPEEYWRALYVIERRRVVLRIAPGAPGGGSRSVQPIPDPDRVDPWSIKPAQLEVESRVVAQCPTCKGAKRTTCQRCQGTSRMRCGQCSGSGRVLGQRKLLKNCPSCRGRGNTKCTQCVGGHIDCQSCGADGRVDAWLAMECSTFTQVRAGPEGAALKVHERFGVPEDFDARPEQWPHQLVKDTGLLSGMQELPTPGLAPELHPVMDRVQTTRIQHFQAQVHRIKYQTSFSEGYADVCGSPPRVSPSSNWRPLQNRRLLVGMVLLGLGLASLLLRAIYVDQHSWFAHYGHGDVVLGFALAASALSSMMIARSTLSPRTKTLSRLSWPMGGTVAAALATLVASQVGGPSLAHARQTIAAGEVDSGRLEAHALWKLGMEAEGACELLDTLHLKEAKAAPTLSSLLDLVRQPWCSPQARAAAIGTLEAAAAAEEAQLHAEGPPEQLERLAQAVGELAPAVQERARVRAALLRAQQCLGTQEMSCVVRELTQAAAANAPTEELEPIRAQAEQAAREQLQVTMKSASRLASCEREQPLQEALELARQYGPLLSTASSTSWQTEIENRRQRAKKACFEEKQLEAERQAREQARRERAAQKAAATATESWREAPSRSYHGGKHCTKGCPCGNSCIACWKTCTK
jgi:hypothetical protein